MAFEKNQIRKLRAKLQPQHIRSREADGVTLRYVEGWHVISEANRIFGFDGWDRETIETKCVYTKQTGNRYAAAYIARVRIIVYAGERRITREGSGAGEATTYSPGSAHEMASKAAETDATKRALMTFGNPFGLSLYSPPVCEPAVRNCNDMLVAEGSKPKSVHQQPVCKATWPNNNRYEMLSMPENLQFK